MYIEQKQDRIFKPTSVFTRTAEEDNQITTELQNLITAGGLTPDASDLTQVKKAVENIGASAAGAANIDLSNLSSTGESHFVQLQSGVTQANVDYVIERGGTDALWYEIWKSGRLRQGGTFTGTANYGIYHITFLKEFSNANYTVNSTAVDIEQTWSIDTTSTDKRTTTDVGGCVFYKTSTYIAVQAFSSRCFVAEGWLAS